MADRRAPSHNAEGAAELPAAQVAETRKVPNYTAFFAQELVELGARIAAPVVFVDEHQHFKHEPQYSPRSPVSAIGFTSTLQK